MYVCTDAGRLYTLGQHILALIGGRRAGIGCRSTRRFQIWDSLRGPFIKLRGAPPLGSVRARPPRTSRVLREPRENSGLARDPFPLLSPTAYTHAYTQHTARALARAQALYRGVTVRHTDAHTGSFCPSAYTRSRSSRLNLNGAGTERVCTKRTEREKQRERESERGSRRRRQGRRRKKRTENNETTNRRAVARSRALTYAHTERPREIVVAARRIPSRE